MNGYRDFAQDVLLIKRFFRNASDREENNAIVSKYTEILTLIANREASCITVEIEDVQKYDESLADEVKSNTSRYVKLFCQAIDEILPTYKTKNLEITEPLDIFIEKRLDSLSQPTLKSSSNFYENGQYPAELLRNYDLYFKPASLVPKPLRELKAVDIGKLSTIEGIVMKVKPVVPRALVVVYTCLQCGKDSFEVSRLSELEFTPKKICSSATCLSRNVPLLMPTKGAKLIRYQEVTLQENILETSAGRVPETLILIMTGENTRKCDPADYISVSGVYSITFNKLKNSLMDLSREKGKYFNVHYISHQNKDSDNDNKPLSEDAAMHLVNSDNFLNKFVSSIAPEIHGLFDVKKSLLLSLVGGADKNHVGMKIKGNINVLLLGDPGVAKSQLLSFIERLTPKCILVNGRGSSAVGLTASLSYDSDYRNFVLSSGALVQADKSVCCIDEFDKMNDIDRSAIHEAMEQQTVSISKAGMTANLNARTTILAAANPIYGRYNSHRTISENLNLPQSLISRFDLLWIIKDKPDRIQDLKLAEHISRIHSNPELPILGDEDIFDIKTMRSLIALCKKKQPIIPEEFEEKVCKIYEDIRTAKYTDEVDTGLFTSPRSILAILRLTTAFARLRLSEEVVEADIDAAMDIYKRSLKSMRYVSPKKTQEEEFLEILKNMRDKFDTNKFKVTDAEEAAKDKMSTADAQRILNNLIDRRIVLIDDDAVICKL